MSNNIIEALENINEALGGESGDALNVVESLTQIGQILKEKDGESSGSKLSVELVKLGTISGGGSNIANSVIYHYSGTASLGNGLNLTLGDILGDKKPIGFTVSTKNVSNSLVIAKGVSVISSSNGKVYDLVADQGEEGYYECDQFGALLLYYTNSESDAIQPGTQFDVYAICI